MTNPIDDFVMSNLRNYNKRDIVDAESASLDFLDDNESLSSEKEIDEDEEGLLLGFVKEVLGDKVKEVKATQRLVDSPAVITGHESASMRRMSQFVQHQVRR